MVASATPPTAPIAGLSKSGPTIGAPSRPEATALPRAVPVPTMFPTLETIPAPGSLTPTEIFPTELPETPMDPPNLGARGADGVVS